jgi:hypothetical protein
MWPLVVIRTVVLEYVKFILWAVSSVGRAADS